MKMLGDELGTASNIKSRVNRLSVLAAITSAQQRLKLYNKVRERPALWERSLWRARGCWEQPTPAPVASSPVLWYLELTPADNGTRSGAALALFAQGLYVTPALKAGPSAASSVTRGHTAPVRSGGRAHGGQRGHRSSMGMRMHVRRISKVSWEH